jgi:alkylation response protein AidB-like acyl-CoA dehydrogenase
MAQVIESGGQRMIDDPVIRDRICTVEADLLAAEYNGLRLLTMGAKNEDPGLAGLVPKLHSTNVVYEVTKLAMDILGDHGLFAAGESRAPDMGGFSTAYMWYWGMALGGGAPNIQRNIIGERGLGLPRNV